MIINIVSFSMTSIFHVIKVEKQLIKHDILTHCLTCNFRQMSQYNSFPSDRRGLTEHRREHPVYINMSKQDNCIKMESLFILFNYTVFRMCHPVTRHTVLCQCRSISILAVIQSKNNSCKKISTQIPSFVPVVLFQLFHLNYSSAFSYFFGFIKHLYCQTTSCSFFVSCCINMSEQNNCIRYHIAQKY